MRLDFSALCGRRAVLNPPGLFRPFEFEICSAASRCVLGMICHCFDCDRGLRFARAAGCRQNGASMRHALARHWPGSGVYVVCGTCGRHQFDQRGGCRCARPELLCAVARKKPSRCCLALIIAIVADYIDRPGNHEDAGATVGRRPPRSVTTTSGALTQAVGNISAFVDSVAGPAIEQSESCWVRLAPTVWA